MVLTDSETSTPTRMQAKDEIQKDLTQWPEED